MADIYLTNSLSNKKEKFIPLNPPSVGMYTCGPTVYKDVSVGNFRTYVIADVLYRVLRFNGYKVKHVMNLTDVGHLTGDNFGDADIGEDKMEKSAKEQGKTVWDIAKFYIDAFLKDFYELNLIKPSVFPRATEHIDEQVDLIKKIEKAGFAYKTSDGIYFDTKVYEKSTGKKYGDLSTLESIKEGARVKKNPEKKNPRDFALWKFSGKPGVRQMEWESPWGLGFPGWHLECSAMSMKYLGESFDIHIGGEDLRSIHHPNEIAQSESVTGKLFVKYWIHVTFLKVDGRKMSKSKGNAYTLTDVKKRGYNPMSLRYLFLTAYYRDSLNFTWEALASAQNAYNKLKSRLFSLKGAASVRMVLSEGKEGKIEDYRKRFLKAVNDDLDTPKALSILWEAVKSNIPSEDKYDLALYFDEVLGLRLSDFSSFNIKVSDKVSKLMDERESLRKEGKFEEADKIRGKIYELGFVVKDTPQGSKLLSRQDKKIVS